jgi:hypothetical protein
MFSVAGGFCWGEKEGGVNLITSGDLCRRLGEKLGKSQF